MNLNMSGPETVVAADVAVDVSADVAAAVIDDRSILVVTALHRKVKSRYSEETLLSSGFENHEDLCEVDQDCDCYRACYRACFGA